MGDSPGESLPGGAEASRLVEEAKELQETASSLISRISQDENALRQRVASLESRIRSLRNSKHDDKLEEELVRARYILSEGDAAAYLPSKSHGRFLRMFLGPINVRANRKDVQLQVKEEYNNFRDRTAYLFLCFPSLLLILRSWIWDGCLPALSVQLYQAWLLYLYTGLALRENILRVNGSDIRPWFQASWWCIATFLCSMLSLGTNIGMGSLYSFATYKLLFKLNTRWIKHHYCAMVMALISLTWEIEGGPDCEQKQRGVQLFLKWAIMQGVAMILQNRYQRQRLYTRIALGKARRMDVVWGETAGVQGQLLLLCPILFVLQGFEAYVGVLLLKTALSGFGSDWQVIACGILLIVMAVGNFINTVQTLVTKSRVKAKIKRGKSRQELTQGFGDKSL